MTQTTETTQAPPAAATPTTATPPTVTPLAPRERLLRFQIGESTFAFRRPSRADIAEAMRQYVRRLTAADAALLNALDGDALLAECRLEVGLAPRAINGQRVDLGESAPPHWRDADGAVRFHDVDASEFAAVVAYLDQHVFQPLGGPTGGPAPLPPA